MNSLPLTPLASTVMNWTGERKPVSIRRETSQTTTLPIGLVIQIVRYFRHFPIWSQTLSTGTEYSPSIVHSGSGEAPKAVAT